MIKNYQDMLRIVTTKNEDEQIVDARPPNLFNGKFFFHYFNLIIRSS
jgi:hypothetical protein